MHFLRFHAQCVCTQQWLIVEVIIASIVYRDRWWGGTLLSNWPISANFRCRNSLYQYTLVQGRVRIRIRVRVRVRLGVTFKSEHLSLDQLLQVQILSNAYRFYIRKYSCQRCSASSSSELNALWLLTLDSVKFTVPLGNNFPIIPEYSQIFTYIFEYF